MNRSRIFSLVLALTVTALISIAGCSKQAPEQQTQTIQNTEGQDFTPNPSESSSVNIEIVNFAYNPLDITVKKGATVTWTNLDSASHTVTSESGNELDSDTLSKGQPYSHTFNDAGTFNYYCTIHPRMKATIIVE